jgi:hypothetical protein
MYVAFLTRRGGFISRHAVRAFPLYKWGELSFWLVWRVAAARRPGIGARRNKFTRLRSTETRRSDLFAAQKLRRRRACARLTVRALFRHTGARRAAVQRAG